MIFKKFLGVVEHMTLKKEIKEAIEENKMLEPFINRLKTVLRNGNLKGCSKLLIDTQGFDSLRELQIRYNNNKIIIQKQQEVDKIESKLTSLEKTKDELQNKVDDINSEIQGIDISRNRILRQINQIKRPRGALSSNTSYDGKDACYYLMKDYSALSGKLTLARKDKIRTTKSLQGIESEIRRCSTSLASLTGNPQNNAENVAPVSSTCHDITP